MTTIESRSPQAPDDVVLRTGAADEAEVARVVQRARTAAAQWARTPAHVRAAALEACAAALHGAHEELSALMVREVGKPILEARMETTRGISILRYNAQLALGPVGEVLPAADGRSLLHTRRRPHGVAGLITPWNFPVAIPLWKAAPALATGNAVVLKPSEKSPAVAVRLAELFADALPDGVFQVVLGAGPAGAALVGLADVVSFTGSVRAGSAVVRAAAARGVPVQAEMGGQNASVVLPDADLPTAAATIAAAAMGYAGQKCTATSRVVVVGDHRGFAERLADAVAALPFGDPADDHTVVGPVIDDAAREAVAGAVSDARDNGAAVLTGGDAPDRVGSFVVPTVVTDVAEGDRLLTEEVFGPVCAVVGAADADDAVRITNGVRHGLVTALFTADLGQALDLSTRFDTGMVKVNAPTTGVDFHAPFGGDKASSYGPREQGTAGPQFYTRTTTVTLTPPAA